LRYAPKIVHETLDGETIVIDLGTGNYYSLTGSGAEIWALLEAAGSASEICAELVHRHGYPAEDVRNEVESFVQELEREGLIEQGAAPTSGQAAGSNGQAEVPTETGARWEPPKLECYGDMRDFLLVDPIHEVDETGWPDRRTPQPEAS
jgi:Coenzyme PQQ synthesis protein D (PqqD)